MEHGSCLFQCFFSIHIHGVEGSLLLPPLKNGRSLCCLSLSLNGVLLPCIQGLGSLSLPFPPPPLPACDPTLRPHPSSLCQSRAAQPCRGAGAAGDPTRLQAVRRAGVGRAGQEEQHGYFMKCMQPAARFCLHPHKPNSSCHVAAAAGCLLLRDCEKRHPCHLNDVSQQAN